MPSDSSEGRRRCFGVCRSTISGTSISSSESDVHGALSHAARAPLVVKTRLGAKWRRDQKSRHWRIAETRTPEEDEALIKNREPDAPMPTQEQALKDFQIGLDSTFN